MDYVQTFTSEIYCFSLLFIANYFKVFGEGTNENYLLICFKQFIQRDGIPNDLFTQAATKVLVGYDGFSDSGAGKFKDFRFYYEVS